MKDIDAYELTNDQYLGLGELCRWYESRRRQMISISSPVGTQGFELIQYFLEYLQIPLNQVMFLTMDQRRVMELASDQLHAYYLNRILYRYEEMVDLDSSPIGEQYDGHLRTYWRRFRNKRISDQYSVLVVLDASLMSYQMIMDICRYNRKVILLYDPFMVTIDGSYCDDTKPDISLKEVHPSVDKTPLVAMAYHVLGGQPLKPGAYGTITVIPKKLMNLSNLKANEMNLTISAEMARRVNTMYRDSIMKGNPETNHVGERLIAARSLHDHAISSRLEPRLCFYMASGTVGNITRINRHVARTKYVPFEFTPLWGDVPFTGMSLDRNYLNHTSYPSRQIIPVSIADMNYAYALTVMQSRINHWDSTTIITEGYDDSQLHRRMMYTAVASTTRSITMVI